MVLDGELKSLNKEQRERLEDRRYRLRSLYCSEVGKAQLMDLIRGSKALSKIDEGDNCELGAHNLVIDLLEDLGLLDEGFILHVLDVLKASPAVPVTVGEPIGDIDDAE